MYALSVMGLNRVCITYEIIPILKIWQVKGKMSHQSTEEKTFPEQDQNGHSVLPAVT